jgi:protein associated with RNAse G/E
VILQATYNHKDQDFFGLELTNGDVFIEYHHARSWYNVFAVLAADRQQFKGWYCNITRPAQIGETDIYADDLALDLIIDPSGNVRLIDEQEFELIKLPSDDRAQALRAVEDLRRLAANKAGPFAELKSFLGR